MSKEQRLCRGVCRCIADEGTLGQGLSVGVVVVGGFDAHAGAVVANGASILHGLDLIELME